MSKKAAALDEPDPRVVHTRSTVLAAAGKILVESGPEKLTIDEVIKLTGIARMTIYRHWKSREDLVLDGFRYLVPNPGAPGGYKPTKSPIENLKRGVVAYGREFDQANWANAMPGLLRLAHQDKRFDEIRIEFAQARGQHLYELLADCVESGDIRNIDFDIAISQLMGPISFRKFLSFEPITKPFCERLVQDFIAANS